MSGAVGTYASVPPAVERRICETLGIRAEDASTQVVPRDRHAALLSAIALAGAGLERFATEVRNLQRTEVREVEEPFGPGQKGSSAMPHKRNPITCERITGLARVLRGYAQTGLENVALWHERDISHSGAERVVLPDATIALDYMQHLASPGRPRAWPSTPTGCAANLDLTSGAIFSQRALTALVESGMSRDDAYRLGPGGGADRVGRGDPIRRAAGEERPRPGDRKRAGPERLSRARARGHGASAGVRRVTSAQATTEELRGELEATLSGLIEPGTEIAYVNLPNIGNLGDNAIYAGARRSLDRIGAKVVLALEPRAYRRAVLRRAIGERGTIVIHGGANFGDLYRKQPQQTARRRLLRHFPDARIIQLPQTIYFRDPETSPRFIRLCREHPDFTILARDRVSVERAAGLGFETTLAPDLAFGLGALDRPAAASTPSTWIVREDVERTSEPGSIEPSARDWPTWREQRSGAAGTAIAHRPGFGAPPESRSRAGPRASATPDRADGRAPLPARRGPACRDRLRHGRRGQSAW